MKYQYKPKFKKNKIPVNVVQDEQNKSIKTPVNKEVNKVPINKIPIENKVKINKNTNERIKV